MQEKEAEIQTMVDRETTAWDNRDAEYSNQSLENVPPIP